MKDDMNKTFRILMINLINIQIISNI